MSTAPVARRSGVPGAVVNAYELPEIAIAPNVEMRRYLQAFNAFEVRVQIPVKLVGKQPLHFIAAIFARWQADRMDHDQVGVCRWRSGAKIG